MRLRPLITLPLLVFAASANAQSNRPRDAVRRLAPGAFGQLDGGVRRELEVRGCRIPQPWDARRPTNVIHGAFTAAHVNEWAVLCSSQGVEQILIYRVGTRGSARLIDSLRASTDNAWTQDVGGGRIGYSRKIQTRPRRQILTWRLDVDGHAIPQPIDHDAIEDIFLDKSAEALYYATGRWYRQVTAD